MSADDLGALLTSFAVVRQVAEAISHPERQAEEGWNLCGWQVDALPWAIHFRHRDAAGKTDAAVWAVKFPESRRDEFARALSRIPWPWVLVMLGRETKVEAK